MAENTIEIEVDLVGQKETLKGLDQVKDGAEGIGETFKGVSSIVGQTNERLGESISSLSDAVSEGAAAFQGLRDAAQQVGQGSIGISTLLGPLALLVTAIGAAYEAYRQFSGAAKEAEDRQEALAAAAGDLTSKLEELSEKGLVPAIEDLKEYSKANLQAQIAKEMLQKQIEATSKGLYAEQDAVSDLIKAVQHYNKVVEEYGELSPQARIASEAMKEAQYDLQKQAERTEKSFESLAKKTRDVQTRVTAAAEAFKEMEEQTKDALEAKAKEQAAQLASILALRAEADAVDEVHKLQLKRHAETVKAQQLADIEKASREELADLVKAQALTIEALNEEQAKDVILSKQIAELQKKKAEATKGATKAIDQQALALKVLEAQQRQQLMLESQLRQLQIQIVEEGFTEQTALARERYETGLELAKDNATQRAIVEAQYQLEVQRITDAALEADLKRMDEREQRERQALEESRRLATERIRIEQEANQQISESMIGYFDELGKGFVEASVGALMFGDSFQSSIKDVLEGIAREASVKSLMEFAEAAAYSFSNPLLAAQHAKAGGIYAAAAVAAKSAHSAMKGGGAGGAGGATSPSGSALTAPAPQREQASTESMVFNINFGGAVIYDTRRAAEQALADRVVETINRPRRGAVRLNSRG